MRKSSVLLALGVGALAVAAGNGQDVLGSFAKALADSDSLHVVFSAQPVAGAPMRYSVDLQKPNKARIDGPTRTIVADGSTITTFDKTTNEYSKRPQTDAELQGIMKPEELNLWAGFFNENAYQAYQTFDRGQLTVAGTPLKAVEASYDQFGKRSVTYYIDPQDSITRQAKIVVGGADSKTTTIVSTSEVSINSVKPNVFAFNAPSTAKQVTWEEMNALKWLTDLEQAKKLAQSTGKKIFVDFMATWCGPCKDLDREVLQKPQFRTYARKLVLLRIDVDAQPNVAQLYKVDAMPTQMVLASNGDVVDSTVGYGGPDAFYKFLDGALSR